MGERTFVRRFRGAKCALVCDIFQKKKKQKKQKVKGPEFGASEMRTVAKRDAMSILSRFFPKEAPNVVLIRIIEINVLR